MQTKNQVIAAFVTIFVAIIILISSPLNAQSIMELGNNKIVLSTVYTRKGYKIIEDGVEVYYYLNDKIKHQAIKVDANTDPHNLYRVVVTSDGEFSTKKTSIFFVVMELPSDSAEAKMYMLEKVLPILPLQE